MRVIDGMHRLMAAVVRGYETIDVEFFDGSESDAFLRAVEANVSHGFPLSQADRRSAAGRIIASHPHMSDRAIAEVTGLGAKTVASIRRESDDSVPQLSARMGKDGKIRPLSNVEGRQKAAALMTERPHASLREVARGAGVSIATASDVRKRLASGRNPVPERSTGPSRGADGSPRDAGEQRRLRAVHSDPAPVLEKLLRDPSLRLSETGRRLLRLLRYNAVESREWFDLASVVPPHCGELVTQLAGQYAHMWTVFAEELKRQGTPPSAPARLAAVPEAATAQSS